MGENAVALTGSGEGGANHGNGFGESGAEMSEWVGTSLASETHFSMARVLLTNRSFHGWHDKCSKCKKDLSKKES